MPKLHLREVDIQSGRIEWPMFGNASAAFVSRPHLPRHMAFMEDCTLNGLPTWVDHDDNLWDVPRHNPRRSYYSKQVQETATLGCTRAYIVTASTEQLAEVISTKAAPDARIYVLPNAFPHWYGWNSNPRQKVILWRGGDNHLGDMLAVADDVVQVLNENPDWRLVTVGAEPWFVTERIPNHGHFDHMTIPAFHHWLRHGIGPAVMLNPLTDCDFNRCKSNISWMEGTMAGAVCVVPDFQEFRQPGALNYREGKFAEMFRLALAMSGEDRGALVAASRAQINEKYHLDVVGRSRYAILKQLIEP